MSPTVIPGRFGMSVSRRLLIMQVREAARSMGLSRPLLWVACPPAADIASQIPAAGIVYQRTDRYESFRNVDAEAVRAWDRHMKSTACLTLFCSTSLYEAERSQCRAALLVDHGVDYPRFADAGRGSSEPADAEMIARPRAGFVGGIDAHTFDPQLFLEVVARLPDVQFVMVGACSLPDDWCRAANVHFLGQKPYEKVAEYMAACDVLIMPWNRSEWIAACNPVKLKEYLAVGRPVVTTWFEELRRFEGFVRTARGAEDFAVAIRAALAQPDDPARLRARVEQETWMSKAGLVLRELCNVCPAVRAA